MNSTYPSLLANYLDPHTLKDIAIIALTLDIVQKINEDIFSLILEKEKLYLSFDLACRARFQIDTFEIKYTPTALNGIHIMITLPQDYIDNWCPNNTFEEIDQSYGLCNDTYLIITKLGDHVIKSTILTKTHFGRRFSHQG